MRDALFSPRTRGDLPYLGREEETARLREAILRRQSLLISGPAGAGKTALVSQVLAALPRSIARHTLRADGVKGLRPLLQCLVKRLFECKDPTLRAQLHREGIRQNTFKHWLDRQSASHLKGALYSALERGRYWVVLDHVAALTGAAAKVAREMAWMRKTPVFLVTREARLKDAGVIASLYWGQQLRLNLGPLRPGAAQALLDSCIQHFGLRNLELDDFGANALSMSRRYPGALVKMCRLAAEMEYHRGSRIKTRLVYIDGLLTSRGCFARPGMLDNGK
jgi:hypothetical protein